MLLNISSHKLCGKMMTIQRGLKIRTCSIFTPLFQKTIPKNFIPNVS